MYVKCSILIVYFLAFKFISTKYKHTHVPEHAAESSDLHCKDLLNLLT